MSTIAELLARKRQVLERLKEHRLGQHERTEPEHLLSKIDTALDLLQPWPKQ